MTTLDDIQELSRARQALWRQKWTRRTLPDYQQKLKALDRTIANLWHDYRCELAGLNVPTRAPHQVDPEIARDFAQQHGIHKSPSRYQVKDGDRWRNVSDDELAEGIQRYVADIPADDGVEIIPLADLLKRRGKTLEFRDAGRMGQVYSTEVKLPI